MKHATGISQKILMTAVRGLTAWENEEMTLDAFLENLREENAPEHGSVSDLLFEYFRHKGFIDELIRKHAKHERIRQDMRLIVACATTQIFFQTGIAPQSAVNIAVDCGKLERGPGGGGFVNALLRTFMRDKSINKETIPAELPKIIQERWSRTFGKEECQRLQSLYESNPQLTFRLRKKDNAEKLQAQGAVPIEHLDFFRDNVFYETATPAWLFSGPWLRDSTVYIQDPATALAFSLLDFVPNGCLLDACAAPGGKTIMLADLTVSEKIRLTVCDRSSKRMFQLNRNLQRAGVHCRNLVGDVSKPLFSDESFDFVLADVPCTNTGVFRRRPDSLWRFTEKRLDETVKLQKEILNTLANTIKPGGVLLYSTCSIEDAEDGAQVRSFLETHPDFEIKNERLLLPSSKHDGAYGAYLKKKLC